MQQTILLRLKDIQKIYHSHGRRVHALKGINFDIYEGEILGLLGVNGAGKTTLSSIIATLHPASSGEIEYKGTSIYKKLYDYRRALAYCPQKPNLHPDITLRENLYFDGKFYGLSDKEIQSRIEELAHDFELSFYLDAYAPTLSGGYQQRFSIARALMHNPKLIILDEPTVGLDPHIRRNLWKFIKKLKSKGVTVILTTHYLDEAEELSDRIVILDKGIVKLIDTPSSLKNLHKKARLEDVFITLMEENKQ